MNTFTYCPVFLKNKDRNPFVLNDEIKRVLALFAFCFCVLSLTQAQNVGINKGGSTPKASAILDLNTGNGFGSGTSKGLLIPNVALTSTTDATTIPSPELSLMVYCTGTGGLAAGYYYNAASPPTASWTQFGSGAAGGSYVKDSAWLLTGNFKTTPGTNYIGTNDGEALEFAVNGNQAGWLDYTGNKNTFFGYETGYPIATAGSGNIGIGWEALYHNKGSNNIGIGTATLLFNISGGNNIAIGTGVLNNNVSGSNNAVVGNGALVNSGDYNSVLGTGAMNSNQGEYNTALGYNALSQNGSNHSVAVGNEAGQNTAGGYSVFVGDSAGYGNAQGEWNTDIGYAAGVANGRGSSNTDVGTYAGLNNIGNQNVFVGDSAGYNNGSSQGETFIGYQAGAANSGGSGNTALGYQALSANTSGISNTALGYHALLSNTTSQDNTAVGLGALQTNTTSSWNTAVGFLSLFSNNGGNQNTAVGYAALQNEVNGSDNVAVGNLAMNFTTSGTVNVAVGASALESNLTGNYNTVVGGNAFWHNQASSQNTAIGFQALAGQAYGTATNTDNVAVGYDALQVNNPTANSNGIENTAVGDFALQNNTIGTNNNAFGYLALSGNTTGSFNTAVGDFALQKSSVPNPIQGVNLGIGYEAAQNTQAGGHGGFNDFAIGFQALQANTTWINNTAVGEQALEFLNGGEENTAIGQGAQQQGTTGSWNTSVGINALLRYTTGSFNTQMGAYPYIVTTLTTASNNTSMGYLSLENSTSGGDNAAIGYNTMNANTTGIQNAALGSGSLTTNVSGSANTAIGYNANVASGALSNATAVGANSSVSTSNTITLGSAAVTQTEFNGALEPFYSAAYQPGTSGQILVSKGALVAPQWANASTAISSSGWLLLGNAGITQPAVPATYGTSTIGIAENFLGNTDAKDLTFGTSDIERMRVLSTGNIGIGTAAPISELHIKGAGTVLNFGPGQASTGLLVSTIGSGSDGQGGVMIGQCGKQTSSPYGWTFDLIGNNVYYDSPTDKLKFYSASGGGYTGCAAITLNGDGLHNTIGPRVAFWAGQSSADPIELMSILASGNVGIGTTTPKNGLDIASNAAIGTYAGTVAGPADGLIVSGNVGIGCSAPSYALQVTGSVGVSGTITAVGVISSGAITACSDVRYKKNIIPLQNSLQNIMKLQGVNYEWKKTEFPDKHFTDGIQVGFIAQEIEKIYPQMVFTDDKGYKSVDYSRLTPVLVEGIKEQQHMIDSLKATINNLQTRNEQLEGNLNKEQSSIEDLKNAQLKTQKDMAGLQKLIYTLTEKAEITNK